MTFVCYAHGSKYIKCNSSHKVEHHREMAWYFFFLSQQFIILGVMIVCAYRRNYVWSINTLTFLCSYPTQRTTKELNL